MGMQLRGVSCGMKMQVPTGKETTEEAKRKRKKKAFPLLSYDAEWAIPHCYLGSRINQSYHVPLVPSHHSYALENRGDTGVNRGPSIHPWDSGITSLTLYP